jgi:hypothetical protein
MIVDSRYKNKIKVMSKTIKPKQGVVYECYKGFTDIGGDRCRTGQKFIWDGETKVSDIYVLQKASGRGMEMYVRGEEFASYFIPVNEQTETKPKFKIGDKVIMSDDSQWHSWSDFNNPANTVGIILEINDEDLGIVVEWPNELSNSYNERDLLLVTGKAKSKSYIDGVENKDSKKLKENNMNINLNAIAITDLEQIKAIAELIPSVKEQIMAQYPQLFEPEVTHKVGNRYEHSDGNTYILTGEHGHVALTNLSTGMVESRTVSVEDYNKITADEFEALCDDTEELELIEY